MLEVHIIIVSLCYVKECIHLHKKKSMPQAKCLEDSICQYQLWPGLQFKQQV